jgi:hypothetical protein
MKSLGQINYEEASRGINNPANIKWDDLGPEEKRFYNQGAMGVRAAIFRKLRELFEKGII